MKTLLVLLSLWWGSSALATVPGATEFHLLWDKGALPFEIKTGQGPPRMRDHVSKHGVVQDLSEQVPGFTELKDGKVSLRKGESAVIYLLIRNLSKKTWNFAVAPHATQPGSSALGFSFNCLCNDHVYKVGPEQVWYRVMLLSANSSLGEGEVELKHLIFEVTPPKERPSRRRR